MSVAARPAGSAPPENIVGYSKRFEEGYWSLSDEIVDAQEARNALRAGPRAGTADGADLGYNVTLSKRFCGLEYEDPACAPDDVTAYDSVWAAKCCAPFSPPLPARVSLAPRPRRFSACAPRGADNSSTKVINPQTCTPEGEGLAEYREWGLTSQNYDDDYTACTAATPLDDDTACMAVMICTETAGQTGTPDQTDESTCRGNFNEADCAQQGTASTTEGCTWMGLCKYFDGRAQCNADDVDGETSMVKYLASIFPPFALGITVSIVFPVLCFLWYMLRCFNCFGGRKPQASRLLICPGKKEGFPLYNSAQTGCVKLFFLLFFIITLIAGVIGFVGNGLLNDGLMGTTDAFLYEMAKNIENVEKVLTAVVAFEAGNSSSPGGMDNSMTDFIVELKCMVAGMQVAVKEDAPAVFEIRALVVLAVCGIPIVTSAFGVFAALFNGKRTSCCVALMMSMLMIIVWISFGLHSYLGMLFGDLCLEMDLALQFPPGTPVQISFLPTSSNPCLTVEADFGHLPKEVEAGAALALPVGVAMIKDFCNKEGDFSALADFAVRTQSLRP